jgi:hypothetical protein
MFKELGVDLERMVKESFDAESVKPKEKKKGNWDKGKRNN